MRGRSRTAATPRHGSRGARRLGATTHRSTSRAPRSGSACATPGDEVPARVDAILAALGAPAHRGRGRAARRRRAARGPRPGLSTSSQRVGGVGRRGPARRSRPGPGGALLLPDAGLPTRTRAPPAAACARPRLLRLRHDDAGRPRHLGGRARRRRRRADRRRPGRGRRARTRTRCAGRRGTTSTRAGYGGSCYLNNAAVAAEALRARRAGRSPLSTSTRTTATARRRSSGTATTSSSGRSTSTRRPAGSRTSSATRTRPTDREPQPAAAPGTGDEGWLAAVREAAEWLEAEALVVSLGVDAGDDDPESPLRVTADGFREAGRVARRARPADGARPGGRLRPRHARTSSCSSS